LSKPYTTPPSTKELTGFPAFLETVKPVLPIPALLVILPLVWLFFKKTWRELDLDAQKSRGEILARGEVDKRPFVALALCAVVLTMQEYYGGRVFFDQVVGPWLQRLDAASHPWVNWHRYDELYGYAWWAVTRIGGYLSPFLVWKIAFRTDSLRDLGLRTKGFFDHAWIYGLFLAVVLPAMLVVSRSPDFGSYYPFYKSASRSWPDFLVWEAMYFAQFFALEAFFRGFWLGVLRKSFGSGAIFAMAVPYCMIHYGKPYLEAIGAVVAGVALGSLSMKTKSIYQGFLVHITVAALMDWLALRHRHCTPLVWHAAQSFQSCAVDATERDALARKIEMGFGGIVLVLAIVIAGLVLRARRRRQASAVVPDDAPSAG
jgi:membrane protease YdiL (CAAX protease family)